MILRNFNRLKAEKQNNIIQIVGLILGIVTCIFVGQYAFFEYSFDRVNTDIAIFIACIGLFGLSSMLLDKRTKEIGIRKVNGARISEVLVMLNKDFVKWVTIAFVIAAPVAYYAMTKWLENFAYKTDINWWIFALAGLLTLGIILITVSWQSWKAATSNPVEALRYE